MTSSNKIIIRFKKPIVEQTVQGSCISRVVGFISPINLLQIVKEVGLKANPRDAKENRITADIVESITNNSTLYPFKTKGVLVAASHCKNLERERFEISFENPDIEGVLDGGHNVFAIIKYLLEEILNCEQTKAKLWLQLKPVFEKNYDTLISELKKDAKSENPFFDFCIPLELIKPVSEEYINDFKDVLIDICGARNNNVQLKDETKDNKEGLYDFLKDEVLPKEVSDRIIWKSNGSGDIPSTEIIALSWVALKKLDETFSQNKIYSSKGECIQRYADLVKAKDAEGGYKYSVKNGDSKIVITSEILKSALRLLAQIPALYDFIYKEFPNAYNAAGGSFGRIKCVKKADIDNGKPFHTKYYKKSCDYSYPEGFIVPIICGASALITTDKDGLFIWKEDPVSFYKKHLGRILKSYKGYMDMANWDPQTVGKNLSCYNSVEDLVSLLVE